MYALLKQCMQLVALVSATVLVMGCEVDTSTSDSGSSSGSSTSGSAFNYGGYTHNYTCPISGPASAPIPPTTTASCENTYERYAEELGCNNIDNYPSLVDQYKACYDQDVAACYNSPNDPVCTG